MLGEEAALGALGLTELTITPAEELVLAEPVPIDEVRIKPTGQPYLSHPSYTKWFNRAFGRLGWAIVPRAKPRLEGEGDQQTMSCPYMLFIHGKPAAFALGEQEYHGNNPEQTYGDAYEATVASALRRCAKRLGVGLELWDRPWLDRYMREQCVKVFLKPRKEGDKPRVAWRRRNDPKFWNESGAAREEGEDMQQQQPRPPAAGHDGRGDEFISRTHMVNGQRKIGQVERLGIIMRNSGRDDIQVKMWLVRNFGIDTRKEIKRKDYEAICEAIEKPGPLPEWRDLSEEFRLRKAATPAGREPGEEG